MSHSQMKRQNRTKTHKKQKHALNKTDQESNHGHQHNTKPRGLLHASTGTRSTPQEDLEDATDDKGHINKQHQRRPKEHKTKLLKQEHR